LNPWLPPCERVGGERHANLHLRSSHRTVRGEVRWRDEGELLHGPSAALTDDPILTMDRGRSAVLSDVSAARGTVSAAVMGPLLAS
jgi:hypothetical protein